MSIAYDVGVNAAVEKLRESWLGNETPTFGIVLGSGLGDLAEAIQSAKIILYTDIPNFPLPSVGGHDGKLIIGTLEGVSVIAMKGRKHFYEVADKPDGIEQVVFPVDVLASLGVPNYFVTNAAGGLNRKYHVGDAMVIRSHINLLPNPLLYRGQVHRFRRIDGKEPEHFQPMNNAYDAGLRKLLRDAGASFPGHVHEGVYIAGTGPSYETEAECVAFRDGFKADAVGMSTTPEVIVARNRGMRVVGMSCITNVIGEDGTNATNHDEVKRVLESAEVRGRLTGLMQHFFRSNARTE